jgi:hypothetical protein
MKARILTERSRQEMIELQKEFDKDQKKYEIAVCAVANLDDVTHSEYFVLFQSKQEPTKGLIVGSVCGINATDIRAKFYKEYIRLSEEGM